MSWPRSRSVRDTARGVDANAALGVTAAACLGVLLVLPARGGVGHAVGTGVTAAAGSALTLTVLHSGLSWQTVLVGTLILGLAVGGLLLSQSAYAGGLGAPLAVLTLTNPVVSSVIGCTLLGERIPGGLAGATVAAVGAVVAARGIVLLAAEPVRRPTSPPTPARAHAGPPAVHHPARS